MDNLRILAGALCVLFSTTVAASFHTYRIDELYSNADGTIQYIVLHESQDFNGEDVWGFHVRSRWSGRTAVSSRHRWSVWPRF